MIIKKGYSFVNKRIINSNLKEYDNNLYIKYAVLHNSENLHPVKKISELWGDYKKIKTKAHYYSDNALMFRIYKELDEEFSFDTIYLTNKDENFLFAIKYDEVVTQKTIIQDGVIFLDKKIEIN